MTRVAVLTPPGTGAIATLAVVGPRAWELAHTHFRPAGKPLPEVLPVGRTRFGTLGGDEVVLAVLAPDRVEVHCHGGRQVVRLLVSLFVGSGCVEVGWSEVEATPTRCDGRALEPLTRASTIRTAGILLDQYHNTFTRADDIPRLAALAPVGRHLVTPWRVTVAGPPNVGKSSLVNALAGFQRSIVAPTAGTTRDVVTVQLALDGWPVELADTAGVREAEGLEAAGIARARTAAETADLVLWVLDGSAPAPELPPGGNPLLVLNKTDQPPGWDWTTVEAVRVSATTGTGLADLSAAVTARLVPNPPLPGEAVPFTPALAALADLAGRLAAAGKFDQARALLASARPD